MITTWCSRVPKHALLSERRALARSLTKSIRSHNIVPRQHFTISSKTFMPFKVGVARHQDLSLSRYALTLSTGKKLVLFRLPTIESDARTSRNASQPATNEVAGWSYFAMEAECPHAGGPMTEAHVDIEDSSYIASCPWHAYDFNVETGESSYGMKACTFPITIEDDLLSLTFEGADHLKLASIEPVAETVKFKHKPRVRVSDTTVERGDAPNGGLAADASLCEWCAHILNTADPELKIELTTQLFSIFAKGGFEDGPSYGHGRVAPPETPPRPAELNEVKPWEMPISNRGGSLKSRISMLHALANIEQWAIDLALDICIRFATFRTRDGAPLPRAYFHDWLKVANDEAKHFSLLRARLEELGSRFGALPVHHGLWESAAATAHDLRARISVIALVHEARGLDVNPATIAKFRRAGDEESARVLDVIHHDEITHVTTGHRWLCWICEREGADPVQVFRENVRRHFKGAVKGPFNADARLQAGMDGRYYEDLNQDGAPRQRHVIAGG